MKFQSTLQVLGMKATDFKADDGTHYDTLKAYCITSLDATRGNSLGASIAEFTVGLSADLEKYRAVKFPFNAQAELEMVTNGKVTKFNVLSFAPAKA